MADQTGNGTDPATTQPAQPASSTTQPQPPFSDSLNSALDEVDRLTQKRDAAKAALDSVPDDGKHTAERTRAAQSLQEFENQLSISSRKVTEILRQQAQVANRPNSGQGGSGSTRAVPQYKTPQGLYTKDGPAGADGQPTWRLAQDANGNPIGAAAAGPGTTADTAAARTAIAQQNADTAQQRAGTSAATSQQNADTASQRADTAAAVGQAQVGVDQARTSQIAALTPYQIQDLQSRGILTAAQAAAITDKTPAQIAQMQARGELSGTQADQIRQKMALALAPVDVAAPNNQQYITQRNPATGEITYIPNKNYQPTDVGQRVTQLKTQAAAKRDEISQKMASGALTAEQGAAQFSDWWDTNIAPQQQELNQQQASQQAQAQIVLNQEQRAQDEQQRSNYSTAQQAGKNAVDAVQSQQGNFVGPGFGTAVNQIAEGFRTGKDQGPIDIAAATSYKAPDYNAISEQAVARALAHISPTAAGKLGSTMPTIPQGIDINSQLSKTQYAPTTTIAPDGTVTISHTPQPQPPAFQQSGIAEGSNRSLSPPVPPDQMFGNYTPSF